MKANKKPSVQQIDDSVKRSCTKYKRLKNLVKKSLEISVQCGLKINVLVYDPRFHKVQEVHTNQQVSLQSLFDMIRGNKDLPKNR